MRQSSALCLCILTFLCSHTPLEASESLSPIIILTQTPCQFLEPEEKDQHYASHKKEDCEQENKRSQSQRLHNSKILKLKAGHYIFRVHNKNVPYSLGFWLRGSGLQRITLPSVSGGGLDPYSTKDYPITLKAGKYIYSCPLNPTPNYVLIVE